MLFANHIMTPATDKPGSIKKMASCVNAQDNIVMGILKYAYDFTFLSPFHSFLVHYRNVEVETEVYFQVTLSPLIHDSVV